MIFECHGHIILDGVAYTRAVDRHINGVDEAFIRCNLKENADRGIVYYRDGGDKHGASVFAKTVANEYGIDYRTSAFIIHKNGHYGSMFGRAYDNLGEYRKLVSEALLLGADFVKTTASGLLDFAHGGKVTGASISFEELNEAVKIAHGEGLAVMIHANGADNIKRAAEAGADSIEHGYYMNSSALSIMLQTGAVWVPTCVTAANLIGSGKYDDRMLRKIVEGHKATLSKAMDVGVLVACGSDAGASCVFQGGGTLDEATILKSIGIDHQLADRRIQNVFKRM